MIRLLIRDWTKAQKEKLLSLINTDIWEMESDEECSGKCALCKYNNVCIDLRSTANWLNEQV